MSTGKHALQDTRANAPGYRPAPKGQPVAPDAHPASSFRPVTAAGYRPAPSSKPPAKSSAHSVELQASQLEPGKTYVEATSLGHDLGMLLLKIAGIVVCFVVLFTLVFGAFRNPNGGMSPAVHDGDLVLFYRLDKNYVVGNVTAVEYEGSVQALRVVAVAGDTVDITDEGLLVNGNTQSVAGLTEQTLPYTQGVSFPLQVGEDEVFLLGDAREHAADGRVFGCVRVDDTQGKVISLVRTRNV